MSVAGLIKTTKNVKSITEPGTYFTEIDSKLSVVKY